MKRWSSSLQPLVWATAWARAPTRQPRQWVKHCSAPQSRPSTPTGLTKRLTRQSVSRCVSQVTLLPQAHSLSSPWLTWVQVSWHSLPAVQQSQSTKPFSWTIQVILQSSTRSCRTLLAHSSPTHPSDRSQESHSLSSALSSIQNRHDSTTFRPNSCSTIRRPTCSKYFCKAIVIALRSL